MSKTLQRALAEGAVTVKFTKSDGTERVMICTKDFGMIPPEQHPLPTLDDEVFSPRPEDLEKVFDLEKNAWRSFKPSRVIEWSDGQE